MNGLPSFFQCSATSWRNWLWYPGVGDLPWQHQAANVTWHCGCYMHRNPEVCIIHIIPAAEITFNSTVLCMLISIFSFLFHESCSLILVNTAVFIMEMLWWPLHPHLGVFNGPEVHTSPLPSSLSSFAFLHTGPNLNCYGCWTKNRGVFPLQIIHLFIGFSPKWMLYNGKSY